MVTNYKMDSIEQIYFKDNKITPIALEILVNKYSDFLKDLDSEKNIILIGKYSLEIKQALEKELKYYDNKFTYSVYSRIDLVDLYPSEENYYILANKKDLERYFLK